MSFADHELEQHRPKMIAQAWRLTGSSIDAEDVVQESMIRALRSRDRFETGTNLGGWLNRIVYTTFINEYRKAQRAPHVSWDGEVDDIAVEAKADLSPDVRAALESLPPLWMETVVMVDLYGYGYRDVAERMGCPPGTVGTRLHRARAAMREALS